MKTKAILLILVFHLFFVGCKKNDGIDKEIKLTEKASKLVEADNQFGLELFQKIMASEEADNMMASPLSVALALAMTYNGANGETQAAMENALKLNGLSPESINESYLFLVDALKSVDEKVILEIANAIYYRQDFSVEPDFISTNQNYYDAEVSPLDFASPASVDIINDWVSAKTHGKIPSILSSITHEQVMFLLNAIYFKGIWAKEFNSESTIDYPFYPESGPSNNVGMMCRLDTLDYTKNNLFSAIKLPYGKGSYNMYVFLPGEGKTTSDVVSALTLDNWATWMEAFTTTKNVDIKMPKFKFSYEKKLNDVLTDMGMGVAFGSQADFTGINSNGGLNIGFVKHKTFVDVNEEGTEAAAVTVVSIEFTSVGSEPQKIPFYVNKPFLFAITEKNTGAILFIGKVSKPEYNN